jgi:hypothetical protein
MKNYELDRPKKGIAYIVNNLHDEQPETRNDVANLESMFKKINVQVDQVKLNQDKNELRAFAAELEDKDMNSYNLFFLVVISHGRQGDKIVCDSGAFGIECLVESLSKNKSMKGYPKILIFDICRGGEVNFGEVKATIAPPPRIPFGSDIFIGFATTKGYASATDTKGSPFIDAFCSCTENLFDKEPFICIFQEVQHLVSQRVTRVREPTEHSILNSMQVPESRSTLRNQLYLLDKSKYKVLIHLNLMTIAEFTHFRKF